MSARESAAVAAAAEQALADPSVSLRSIAKQHEIALSSLRRAMRRRGEAPRPQAGSVGRNDTFDVQVRHHDETAWRAGLDDLSVGSVGGQETTP